MSINELKPVGFASASLAVLGLLAGRANQVLVASVSPVGYGLALGLTPLAAFGIFKVLTENKINPVASAIFGGVVGYLGSVGITNLLGFEVSLVGPFAGMFSLAGSAVVIGIAAIPIIIIAGGAYYAATRRQ